MVSRSVTQGQERFRSMVSSSVTQGQERFRSMAPMYYRKANAAMLIYDLTSADSFYDIKDWVGELKKNVDTPIVMCLVGNKCDMSDCREVTSIDAEEYASTIGALNHETSALKNTGIDEAFLQVAQQLIKLYETSPNSGLHTVDTADHSSPAPAPTDTGDTFRLASQATPPSDSSQCSC
ncbi:ras-related protein Rab-31-like isoform X2 [Mizuhopecten yessoensis]|uniref:ras-related protein Rab-31-like isoform X2 n=1 Tax=Mizuhopecten yessoensis TaxID=6573 RepID=UPI000B45D75F|nr:ras-related protein Rab-31-like isoform X2 [Mizuhopecten yessoensis]